MENRTTKPIAKQAKYRAEILNAAEIIIMKHGFNKATMEAMSKQAGISRRTVYRLFSNRDVLLAELFESHSVRTRAPLYETVSGLEFDDAFLKAAIQGVKIAREDPLVMELMYGSGAGWYQKQMLDFDSPMYQMFISILFKFWEPVLNDAKEQGVINNKLKNIEIIKWFANVQYLMIIQTNMDLPEARELLEKFFIPALKYQADS